MACPRSESLRELVRDQQLRLPQFQQDRRCLADLVRGQQKLPRELHQIHLLKTSNYPFLAMDFAMFAIWAADCCMAAMFTC